MNDENKCCEMYCTLYILYCLCCNVELYYVCVYVVTRAYRRGSIQYHPDKNTNDPRAHDKFVYFTKISDLLRDPVCRSLFDKTGIFY